MSISLDELTIRRQQAVDVARGSAAILKRTATVAALAEIDVELARRIIKIEKAATADDAWYFATEPWTA